jgi:hypothetical protein
MVLCASVSAWVVGVGEDDCEVAEVDGVEGGGEAEEVRGAKEVVDGVEARWDNEGREEGVDAGDLGWGDDVDGADVREEGDQEAVGDDDSSLEVEGGLRWEVRADSLGELFFCRPENVRGIKGVSKCNPEVDSFRGELEVVGVMIVVAVQEVASEKTLLAIGSDGGDDSTLCEVEVEECGWAESVEDGNGLGDGVE